MILNLILILIEITTLPKLIDKNKDYTIVFDRIDNKVEVMVNDSLVFSSGIIDNNPDLKSDYKVYLGNYLTESKDEVIIRLYNGFEPYQDQDDKHWEIQYVILKGEEEYEYMWDYEDDYRLGIVFEEKYYL